MAKPTSILYGLFKVAAEFFDLAIKISLRKTGKKYEDFDIVESGPRSHLSKTHIETNFVVFQYW